MGWLFACNRNHDRQACIEELRRPSRYGEGQRLLKSTVVGNHHWYVAEIIATGERYIGLDLMQSGYPQHGWGYKDMTESCGPCYYDCPLGFLDLVPNVPEPYGAEWREKVRQHHAKRADKRRNPPKPGDLVSYGGTTYTLVQNLGRRGWSVAAPGGNPHWHTMRMTSRQLAQATRPAPTTEEHSS